MSWSLQRHFQGVPQLSSTELSKKNKAPMMGWKYLRFNKDAGKFYSPVYEQVMVPNSEMKSECRHYFHAVHKPHTAPEASCACGFHVCDSPDDGRLRHYCYHDGVLCLFFLNGKAVRHTGSTRAERVLFVGVVHDGATWGGYSNSTHEIKQRFPNLLVASTPVSLVKQVLEAYQNGYWSGAPVVEPNPHPPQPIGNSSSSYGTYYHSAVATTSGYASSNWQGVSYQSVKSLTPGLTRPVNKAVRGGEIITWFDQGTWNNFVAPDGVAMLHAITSYSDGSSSLTFSNKHGVKYIVHSDLLKRA